jgi:hypothetical protein
LLITIKMCCIFRNFSNGANYARDLLYLFVSNLLLSVGFFSAVIVPLKVTL